MMHITYIPTTFFLALATTTTALDLPSSSKSERALQQSNRGISPATTLQQFNVSKAPIPFHSDHGVTLIFNYLGDHIAEDNIADTLYYARESVLPTLSTQENVPIQDNRWSFGQLAQVQIIVAADQSEIVTYLQLYSVLNGLSSFMIGSDIIESRNLAFSINVKGKGRVGHGLVWHDLLDVETITRRSPSSTTSLHLSNGTISSATNNPSPLTERIPFPIAGTPIALVFDFFGAAIPPSEFEKAFTAATLDIINFVARDPAWPIPHDRFEYDSSDAHLCVIGTRGVSITWLQLFHILQGLHSFVTRQSTHCQILHYDIFMSNDIIGFGLLWYSPVSGIEATAGT